MGIRRGHVHRRGVAYGDFLLRLTEHELIKREQRAAQKRVKIAKFPILKTLDSFDFGVQPSIKEALVRHLATGEYLEARENVLHIGNSATGKSHLAVALGFETTVLTRPHSLIKLTLKRTGMTPPHPYWN